jgi:hypothetical protein
MPGQGDDERGDSFLRYVAQQRGDESFRALGGVASQHQVRYQKHPLKPGSPLPGAGPVNEHRAGGTLEDVVWPRVEVYQRVTDCVLLPFSFNRDQPRQVLDHERVQIRRALLLKLLPARQGPPHEIDYLRCVRKRTR